MKEITALEKQKIFAKYWGQRIAVLKGIPDRQPVCVGNISTKYCNEFSLLVNPLPDITDEDAIEVAKITQKSYSGKEVTEKRYKIIDVPEGSHPDVTYVLVEIFISHPDIMAWSPFSLVQIDHDDGDVIVGKWDGFTQEFSDDFTDHYIELTDFLRSKGYALPAFGYTVDELVGAGIFKLKTKEG